MQFNPQDLAWVPHGYDMIIRMVMKKYPPMCIRTKLLGHLAL